MYKYVLFNRQLNMILFIIEATCMEDAENKLVNVSEKLWIDSVQATNPIFNTISLKELYTDYITNKHKYLLINTVSIT